MSKSKIWYVDFPTYQYKEDVKSIAKAKGLRVIDSKFKGEDKQCTNAPKLAVIGSKKPTEEKDK